MTRFRRFWLCAVLLLTWAVWTSARQPFPSADHDRRLDRLEAIRIDTRLAVLETQVADIKNLGYAVLVVVIGQLVLGVIAAPRRRQASRIVSPPDD